MWTIDDRRVLDGRVYSRSVEYTQQSCPYYSGTTVMSVTSTLLNTTLYCPAVLIFNKLSLWQNLLHFMLTNFILIDRCMKLRSAAGHQHTYKTSK